MPVALRLGSGSGRNKREVPLPHGTFREQRHIQWTWELWRRGNGISQPDTWSLAERFATMPLPRIPNVGPHPR